MNNETLFEFISKKVQNFTNLEMIENGVAYHYTAHLEKIVEDGSFLGAPINKNLDRTQNSLNSPQARHSPGVVFAYETKESAVEEGFGCDVIKINFRKAIRANHSQENELDNLFNSAINSLSNECNSANQENVKTYLILNTEITSFEKI